VIDRADVLAITAAPGATPEDLAVRHIALQARTPTPRTRPAPPREEVETEVMPVEEDARPPREAPRRRRRQLERAVSPAATTPAAAGELAPCRICETTDPAHGRAQADLCGKVACLERATNRGKRRDRALRFGRELTHDQAVARLARDRADRDHRHDPEDDAELGERLHHEDLPSLALATEGLG
jgi:hypothetical protein